MDRYVLSQISIEALENPALSWGAKGLIIYLQHAAGMDGTATTNSLVEKSETGLAALRTILRELVMHGLIKKNASRKKHLLNGFFWSLK